MQAQYLRENGETIKGFNGGAMEVLDAKRLYVVIKNAIPRESSGRNRMLFCGTFEEKKPKDPSTWYTAPRAEMQMKELAGTGMVEVYNNQHLWNNQADLKRCTMHLWMSGGRKSFGSP